MRPGRDPGDGIGTTLLPSSGPLVALRILFRVGSADDPRGREGLASLTAAMLEEGGAGRMGYAELLDALYPMAASIDVRADKDVTVVSGTVHRDNLDSYYGLLRQVLLEPRFDRGEFDRLKREHLDALVNGLRATDDEGLGKEALQAALYDGHPYGRPDVGTVQGIGAITLDDVESFHGARFGRERCDVGLAGGFPEGFAERVLSDLAALPAGRAGRPSLPAPPRPSGVAATIVTKPARAFAISIGHPIDVTRADDEFYPLLVACSHLGEHRTFHGVLMNAMRARRGLNYGDYAYVESFVQDGDSTFALPNVPRRQQAFSIWIRPVEPRRAHFAIRLALRELARLAESGMSRARFEATRAFLLAYSRLWTQTPSRRLGHEMDGKLHGRASVVDELARRLPAMTVEEVNAAARRHLTAADVHLVVVASEPGGGDLAEALVADRPSPIDYASETDPEILREDREIARFPLRVRADRVRVVQATRLFEE